MTNPVSGDALTALIAKFRKREEVCRRIADEVESPTLSQSWQEEADHIETWTDELAALLQAAAPPAPTADAMTPMELVAQWRREANTWSRDEPAWARARRECADELAAAAPAPLPAPTGERYRFDQVLQIAGLVNAYHNDGTTRTAAETLQAIADVLGPAMGMSALPAPTAEPDGIGSVADYIAHLAGQREELIVALKMILAEPHGCPMCDSGKLRNPAKEHWDDCGFSRAEKLLGRYAIRDIEDTKLRSGDG